MKIIPLEEVLEDLRDVCIFVSWALVYRKSFVYHTLLISQGLAARLFGLLGNDFRNRLVFR